MSNSILITLGHNSSVIFFNGKSKPIGYEEERLNQVKSCSAFPQLSLNKIIEEVGENAIINSTVYVSHWFDNFDLKTTKNKYFDCDKFLDFTRQYDLKVVSLNKDFTHHDAHAYSGRAFLKYNNDFVFPSKGFHYIVADGFGNNQEVLSVYHQRGSVASEPTLVARLYGYKNSIGLMYQFATSYCGMKENQDEYKFLGYESNIKKALKNPEKQIHIIKEKAVTFANDIVLSLTSEITKKSKTLDLIDLHDLQVARDFYRDVFNSVLVATDCEIEHIRTVIVYFIQQVVENVLAILIDWYEIENIVLSGGCFYNVKLNNKVLKTVEGLVSVIPLAGDQGCAIGLYDKYNNEKQTFNFSDLCFGNRKIKYTDLEKNVPQVIFSSNRESFESTVSLLINDNCIVNVLSGEMEFGPRALCNTSTLALPTQENVDYINHLNGRNTVMPMAPVMLEKNISMFRDQKSLSRVIGSNEYMIMTHDFALHYQFDINYKGVTHKYPTHDVYSGRPQIIKEADKRPIRRILENVKSQCLINTSFNTHGTPILYSVENCIEDFKKQRVLDYENRTYLIILTNE